MQEPTKLIGTIMQQEWQEQGQILTPNCDKPVA